MSKSRSFMFVTSSVWVALILVVLVFRGGGAVPAKPRLEPSPVSAAGLAKQAATLADLGDYEGAWRLYYEALVAAPEDVSLWYALGVTLSRLNQREETEKAFQHVASNGDPNSEEVKLARQWLVSAGVLAPTVAFTRSASAAGDVAGDKAVLRGKATWGAPEPNRPPLRVQVLLQGLNGAAEGKRFSTRVTLGQFYRLEKLPVGSYRLIGGVAGQRLWDLSIDVEDGRETVLDLGKDNSSNPTVALHL